MSDKCPHCGAVANEHRPRSWVCGTFWTFQELSTAPEPKEVRSELCRELAAHAETRKERDELNTTLWAWRKAFGSSQLSHAQARLDAAESGVKRLEAALTREREKWEKLREWCRNHRISANVLDALDAMTRLDAEAKEGQR